MKRLTEEEFLSLPKGTYIIIGKDNMSGIRLYSPDDKLTDWYEYDYTLEQLYTNLTIWARREHEISILSGIIQIELL